MKLDVLRKMRTGTISLKMAERQWLATSVQAGLSQTQIRKWLSIACLVIENHRIIIKEIKNALGICYGLPEAVLNEDLGMRWIAAKFVPKLLTPEQQGLRYDVALGTCWTVLENSNWRWVLRILIRPRNESAGDTMEVTGITKAEEGTANYEQCEAHGDSFFRQPGCSSLQIRSRRLTIH